MAPRRRRGVRERGENGPAMVEQPMRGWIEANLDRLHGYAHALSRDHDQARDLVQECALRAVAAARWPTDEPAYRAWLFRILRNAFIDRCRRRGVETPLDPDAEIPAETDTGWRGDQRMVDVVTVRLAIAKLGDAHREVIALVDFAGLSYAEAAEVLEVPRGTVMSRLSRARGALLEIISGGNVTSLASARRQRR